MLSNTFLEYSNNSGGSYASLLNFLWKSKLVYQQHYVPSTISFNALIQIYIFTPEFQAQCLEEMQLDEAQGDVDGAGVLADGPVTTAEWQRAAQQQDFIIQWM